jgi:hypothetical protein
LAFVFGILSRFKHIKLTTTVAQFDSMTAANQADQDSFKLRGLGTANTKTIAPGTRELLVYMLGIRSTAADMKSTATETSVPEAVSRTSLAAAKEKTEEKQREAALKFAGPSASAAAAATATASVTLPASFSTSSMSGAAALPSGALCGKDKIVVAERRTHRLIKNLLVGNHVSLMTLFLANVHHTTQLEQVFPFLLSAFAFYFCFCFLL